MRPHEIETWVLSAHERARTGAPVEDARVEFKATWPDARGAARRIAGHANAARGAPVLWVIGVDEETGAGRGAAREELATWWAQVQAEFDEMAPAVTPLVVVLEGVPVLALLFETDRAPFLVKNPQGGSVQFEVPFRAATGVRTARRSELVRVLSQRQALPEVELLDAFVRHSVQSGSKGQPPRSYLEARMALYVTPGDDSRLVIPFHRCKLQVDFRGGESVRLYGVRLHPATRSYSEDAHPIAASSLTEAILDGPCQLDVSADQLIPAPPPEVDVTAAFDLHPARHDGVVTASTELIVGREKHGTMLWRTRGVPRECRRYHWEQ